MIIVLIKTNTEAIIIMYHHQKISIHGLVPNPNQNLLEKRLKYHWISLTTPTLTLNAVAVVVVAVAVAVGVTAVVIEIAIVIVVIVVVAVAIATIIALLLKKNVQNRIPILIENLKQMILQLLDLEVRDSRKK